MGCVLGVSGVFLHGVLGCGTQGASEGLAAVDVQLQGALLPLCLSASKNTARQQRWVPGFQSMSSCPAVRCDTPPVDEWVWGIWCRGGVCCLTAVERAGMGGVVMNHSVPGREHSHDFVVWSGVYLPLCICLLCGLCVGSVGSAAGLRMRWCRPHAVHLKRLCSVAGLGCRVPDLLAPCGAGAGFSTYYAAAVGVWGLL